MPYRSFHIAIGLLRHDDQILIVQQQGRDDPHPYWVLPGGLVEPGETIHQALYREVQEETGLQITDVQQLAYCTHILHPQSDAQTIAFLFEVARWTGALGVRDPDHEVQQITWSPLPQALTLLQAIGWRGMREPLLAYLRNEAPPGSMWFYEERGENQTLIARYPRR